MNKRKIIYFALVVCVAFILLILVPLFGKRHVDTYIRDDIFTIRKLSEQLEEYRKENGNYPISLSQLVPSQIVRVPKDSCGKLFNYIVPGKINVSSFDLSSSGCDKTLNERARNW